MAEKLLLITPKYTKVLQQCACFAKFEYSAVNQFFLFMFCFVFYVEL